MYKYYSIQLSNKQINILVKFQKEKKKTIFYQLQNSWFSTRRIHEEFDTTSYPINVRHQCAAYFKESSNIMPNLLIFMGIQMH